MGFHYPGSVLVGVQTPEATLPEVGFSLVPNPVATGFATLRIQGVKESRGRVATVRIFDAAGRCVLARQLVTANCKLVIPLDLRALSGGVYLLRFDVGGTVQTRNLVVRR